MIILDPYSLPYGHSHTDKPVALGIVNAGQSLRVVVTQFGLAWARQGGLHRLHLRTKGATGKQQWP